MESAQNLSMDDVQKLLENPSAEARVEVLEKVSDQYNNENFTAQQQKLAEQIFRFLMHDAEVKVRGALSESLKHNIAAPKDIILTLAHDVDEVSLPVLEYSEVLDDEDLVEIIQNTANSVKHLAISNRKNVSEAVSEALVDTANEEVIQNMLTRAAVAISERTLNKIFEEHSENDAIVGGLVNRESLPVELAEKMITVISDVFKDQLVTKHGKRYKEKIETLVERSKQAATFQFMGLNSSEDELISLVNQLNDSNELAQELSVDDGKLNTLVGKLETSGHLTPISALCMGHLGLFEVCLARITLVPVANVKKLMHDESGHGFEALYHKAELPESIFEAVKLVIKVIKEMDDESPGLRGKKAANSMISRILMHAESQQQEVPNLSYFISLIHQHAKKAGDDKQAAEQE